MTPPETIESILATKITIGRVAMEAIGQSLVTIGDHDTFIADIAVPVLLDVVGQSAVIANNDAPVKKDEVQELLRDTARLVQEWKDRDDDTETTPPFSALPIAMGTITVRDLVDRMIVCTITRAARAGDDEDEDVPGIGDAKGLIDGMIAKASVQRMLGSLLLGIDAPCDVDRDLVQGLFGVTIEGIKANIADEMGREPLEGYA